MRIRHLGIVTEDLERSAEFYEKVFGFKRLGDMKRMIPTNCTENDRNPVVDGEMKITVPK